MENLGKQNNREIFFVSHLQEIDDLEKHGRDAPLSEIEKIKKIHLSS